MPGGEESDIRLPGALPQMISASGNVKYSLSQGNCHSCLLPGRGGILEANHQTRILQKTCMPGWLEEAREG